MTADVNVEACRSRHCCTRCAEGSDNHSGSRSGVQCLDMCVVGLVVGRTSATLQGILRQRSEGQSRKKKSDNIHHRATFEVFVESIHFVSNSFPFGLRHLASQLAKLKPSASCNRFPRATRPSIPGLLLYEERRVLVPSAAAWNARMVSKGRSMR